MYLADFLVVVVVVLAMALGLRTSQAIGIILYTVQKVYVVNPLQKMFLT